MESFFFNDTATTEIYTLSLHDALPIFDLEAEEEEENEEASQHSPEIVDLTSEASHCQRSPPKNNDASTSATTSTNQNPISSRSYLADC